jgi:hypothetical protein
MRRVTALGLILMCIGALSGCGSSATTPRGPGRAGSANTESGRPKLTWFAGYNFDGRPVRMIGAHWRVPDNTPSSIQGASATWIGVQQPSEGHGPLIQVGINNYRYGAKLDYYNAFWSDTAHRFRPIALFTVLPNDRISATLVLRKRRWHIRIVDQTSDRTRSLTTRQETSTSLYQAEWLQEDPSVRPGFNVTRHLPYTSTSPVTFSGLAVNGAPPANGLSGVSMTLRRTELDPSRVLVDAFTITEHSRAVHR